MKFISEQHVLADNSLVGGKGSHLQKMVSWGAPVPDFFILTTECFDYYIRNQKLPAVINDKFNSFFRRYPEIALRSSMISEDQIDSSFAGLFDTLLDVTEASWEKSLLKIYESINSPRVKEYIQQKRLTVDLKMAVVAQALVKVEKSGVLFSRSPVSPTAAIAIDAAFGMGEGVVSGTSNVDHYKLTRFGEIIEKRLTNDREVLESRELDLLIRTALELEKKHIKPCDIEWGIKDGKLYLFQIRPITRDFHPVEYFVDTNLSESYPGVVSPFTAGFVKKAYANVFRESAIILGAGNERLDKLNFHYQRLISSVDDHLYYNLEHYYAVLRALPGGEKNIDNWHKMIGGKIEGHAIPFHETSLSSVESFLALASLLRLALKREKTFGPFIKNLDELKQDIETRTRQIKEPKEIIFYLNHLINLPLGFGFTIVNDVFVMIGLGFLTKMLKQKGFQEEEVIDLLKTSDGVDSLKPLMHFNELVQQLDQEFLIALSATPMEAGFDPYTLIFQKLESEGYGDQVKIVSRFLNEFGDRSFEELKLESLPLKNNPILLKQLIEWGSKNQAITKQMAVKIPSLKLNWLEKKVLKFTRDSIATREATRLWRGKFYHLIRDLVLNLGNELKRQDTSWHSFEIVDFFSLTPEEWKNFANHKIATAEVQDLMRSRKSWQTKKQSYPEIIPWVENEPLPQKDHIQDNSVAMSGQGVSQGIVEGIALVLESPEEALVSEIKDYILVTKNTDPAWVYIMSRSLGLISEKGSLLSHTAIIGRELSIPTLVGVKQATSKIKTGDKIRLDATNGKIEFL